MNRAELEEAIEGPAHRQGIQIEDGLTERILDAVSKRPGDLPLLEFALSLLWEKQQNGRLTHAGYEEIGKSEEIKSEKNDQDGGVDPQEEIMAKISVNSPSITDIRRNTHLSRASRFFSFSIFCWLA